MSSEEGYLDRMLYSMIRDELSVPKLGLKLILREFADLGIALTASQTDKLRSDLEGENLERLLVRLDDEQGRQLKSVQERDLTTIEVSVGTLDDLPMHVEGALEQVLPRVLQAGSDTLLSHWKLQASEVLAEEQSERTEFNEIVREVWGEAIERLDMLVSVCMDAGARFNNDLREEAAKTNDLVFEALTRLHARGCQVGSEILMLLRNGFADGAHARWRTLHELAVVAMFLGKHGQTVAERYLEHSGITDCIRAKQYQLHCVALGYPALSPEQLQEVSALRDSLTKKHGDGFAQDYGWAASALPKGRATFAALEQAVALDHLRPFYKLANVNVHAGSKGLYYRIGTPPENDNLLLVGSSLFGLADPGQNTAFSIHQLTAALLFSKPNLDRMAFVQATQMLVEEAFEALSEAHARLETDSAG